MRKLKDALTRRQFIDLAGKGLAALTLEEAASHLPFLRRQPPSSSPASAQPKNEVAFKIFFPEVLKQAPPLKMGLTGVEMGPETFIAVKDNPAEWQKLLDTVVDVRAGFVRLGAFQWNLAEAEEGIYDQTYFDNFAKIVGALNGIGVKVWLNVKGSPDYARNPDTPVCAQLRDSALPDYAKLIDKITQEIPGIAVLEPGNEPDVSIELSESAGNSLYLGCLANTETPKGYYDGGQYYARMVQIAAAVVKRNQPQALIAAGALMLDNPNNPLQFVEGMIDEFAAHPDKFNCDVLTFHAYATGTGIPADIDKTANWPQGVIFQRAALLRSLLAAAGLPNIQLTIGEGAEGCYYWTPEGGTCDATFEDQKAGHLIRSYVRALNINVNTMIWYRLTRSGWKQTDLTKDGTKLPAFYAMRFMAQIFNPPPDHPERRAEFVNTFQSKDERLEGYYFTGADGLSYLALWTNSETVVPLSTPDDAQQIYNYKGEIQPPSSQLNISWFPTVICLGQPLNHH